MIHIGLAEQNKRIAEVMKEKIELSPDFKVELISEGNASNFYVPAAAQWDLMILDGSFLIPHEGTAIKKYAQTLRKLAARLPIVLASSFVDVDQQISALMLGARGVLSKSEQPEKIHQALFQSMEGGMKLSKEMSASIAAKFESRKEQTSFNEDEVQLVSLISEGKSLEIISVRLRQPKKELAKSIQELIKKVFLE